MRTLDRYLHGEPDGWGPRLSPISPPEDKIIRETYPTGGAKAAIAALIAAGFPCRERSTVYSYCLKHGYPGPRKGHAWRGRNHREPKSCTP